MVESTNYEAPCQVFFFIFLFSVMFRYYHSSLFSHTLKPCVFSVWGVRPRFALIYRTVGKLKLYKFHPVACVKSKNETVDTTNKIKDGIQAYINLYFIHYM
jgi:hypothetical protein